jgi:hypothetical protein
MEFLVELFKTEYGEGNKIGEAFGTNVSINFRCALWMPAVSPFGEILSFASPKESIQRKGDPDGPGRCATTLRCSVSEAAAQLTSAVR